MIACFCKSHKHISIPASSQSAQSRPAVHPTSKTQIVESFSTHINVTKIKERL